jgi:predicted dehydrogenase
MKKKSSSSSRRSKAKVGESQPKVRFAVVGLGYISQVALLPAFAQASNSELVALVSDDPVKLKKLGTKYRVTRRCSYDDYDDLLRSGEIDAVYIGLPNTMHADFANRAAKAGIHILCEKPMAVSSAECKSMMRAAETSGVQLMIAYRLHFEAGNLAAVELAHSGKLGELRIFSSDFTMQVRDEDNIRLDEDLGGGPLWDIGIYCVNAARYIFRAEPIEVVAATATNGEKRFAQVEEMATAILRFPGDRLASFSCSFGAADVSSYRVIGTEGSLRVEPAYEHAGDITHHVTIGARTTERTFPKRGQFTAELVHFSECVRNKRPTQASAAEGLNDVRIIEALHRSARTREPVTLTLAEPATRPDPADEIRRPPEKKPALVHVSSPRG